MRALKGDWVEIEQVILEANERVTKLPDDTKSVPLLSYVQGFLEENASVGDEVYITSVIGRRHHGTLVNVKPTFTHHYGEPIKELLPIGQELRTMLQKEIGGEAN